MYEKLNKKINTVLATCIYFHMNFPFQLFTAAISAAKVIVAIFLIVIHLAAGLAVV
jgi:hypothetical protein